MKIGLMVAGTLKYRYLIAPARLDPRRWFGRRARPRVLATAGVVGGDGDRADPDARDRGHVVDVGHRGVAAVAVAAMSPGWRSPRCVR